MAQEPSYAHTCSVLSIVFGAIAFLFFPVIFGPAGLICGIVGVCNSVSKTLGTIGIVVSSVGTVAGMILGALTAL